MDGGGVAGIVVTVVILLLVFIVLYNSAIIVHQAEVIIIERFGRFHKTLQSGLHFIVPFLDRPRMFTWTQTSIDVNGKILDQTTSSYRVDLRESVLNLSPTDCFSKDTIVIRVNSLMFFRITSPASAVYEVDDLQGAVINVAQTQLKDVFGRMTFSEAMDSQEQINNYMKETFGPQFRKYGLDVVRMELLDMNPNSIKEAMKSQMIAERTRRAQFIRAEGQKAATRMKAEGTKRVKFITGVAEQESTRKRSEGAATATVQLAHAESQALDTVASAVANDGCTQTDYMVANRYIDFLSGLTDVNGPSKVIYLPYDLNSLRGLVAHLPAAFGRSAALASVTAARPAIRAGAGEETKGEEFDDLT